MTQEEKEVTEEGTPEAVQEQPAPAAETPPPEEPAEGAAPEASAPVGAGQVAAPEAGGAAERPRREERPERPRRRFGRRKVCAFCVEKVGAIDYKDPVMLRRYLSDRARIDPRRKTGTCTKHQRWLSVALKRARHLALLPYTPEHVRITGVFAPRK